MSPMMRMAHSGCCMTAPRHSSYHRRRDLGRIYTLDGTVWPSVTSVLKQLNAPALTNWLQNQTAEAALALSLEGKLTDDISDDAAVALIRATAKASGSRAPTLGSRVHELIESGDEPPEALVPYVTAAGSVVMGLGDFYAAELTLVNQGDGYAGTADLITVRGPLSAAPGEEELSVLDWKSAKLGAEVGWINHIMQVVALAHCDQFITTDGTLEPLPGDITEVIVAGLRPDGSSSVRTMTDAAKMDQVQTAFLGLLRNWELAEQNPGLSIWETST